MSQDANRLCVIVCDNISQLLTKKYPNMNFLQCAGTLYGDRDGNSVYTQNILAMDFSISFTDTKMALTLVADPTIIDIDDIVVAIDLNESGWEYDLADPEAFDKIVAQVDEIMKKVE